MGHSMKVHAAFLKKNLTIVLSQTSSHCPIGAWSTKEKEAGGKTLLNNRYSLQAANKSL